MPYSRSHEILKRVLTVPDRYRAFSVRRADAYRKFGLEDELVADLLDLGLPHRGVGDDMSFDALDLENVGSGLALLSPQRIIMKKWSRSLSADMQMHRGSYELRISWACPDPGHEGACDFTAGEHVSALAKVGPSGLPWGGAITGLAEPLHDVHEFGPEFDQVTAAARKLVFHRLPTGLGDDLGYLGATGLADCRLGTMHLMQIARGLGMSTRPASGFFVGAPFPAWHVWFEVLVGDRWIAADPFFLNTLAGWGLIDADDWPLDHSPRNVLLRVMSSASYGASLVKHNGEDLHISVMARWSASTA